MSGADPDEVAPDDAAVGDTTPQPEGADASATPKLGSFGGGIARAVRAGAEGEELSASGVLAAIGGVRGIVEAVLPSLVFLLIFITTSDARIAAIIPGALALLLVVARLVQRETIVSALSGMLGVGIAVIITLITGRGVDFYLSGFIVNIVWGIGLLISIVVGWPAIGLLIGALRGDLKSWRRDRKQRKVATWLTVLWLGLFVARLAVQLPMYLSEQVGALGTARIVMGIPLFAIVIVVTWITIQRSSVSSDDGQPESGVISGENTPAE